MTQPVTVVQWFQVCTCGQRCPIHDPLPETTTAVWPPCLGCGSYEAGAHWPNCRYSTTGTRVLGEAPK